MFVMPYLLCCAICDDEKGIIPNFLTASAVFTGLLFSTSLSDFLFKLIMLAILFMLGMFDMLGMGDIKLWMGVACLTNLTMSCFIVLCAVIILIISLVVRRDKESLKASLQPFMRVLAPARVAGRTRHLISFGIYMFYGGAVVEIIYAIMERA